MNATEAKLSLAKISRHFREESDRAAAITGPALLDEQLAQLLRPNLRMDKQTEGMFSVFGPLASFSGRIVFAYALRLIPEDVKQDLDRVRAIRNKFAHDFENLSFSHPEIQKQVMKLKATDWFLHGLGLVGNPPKVREIEEIRTKPRRYFEVAISILSFSLDYYRSEPVATRTEMKSYFQFPEASKPSSPPAT
jgi:hypothetical protein